MDSLFTTDVLPVIGTCLVGFFVFVLLSCLVNRNRWFLRKRCHTVASESDDVSNHEAVKNHIPDEATASSKQTSKKKSANQDKGAAHVCKHDWLVTTLKGHSGQCLDVDFSSNGKYLASCGEDRAILLWKVKEFQQKDHRSVRTNVELDHLTRIRFSPDSKGLVGALFSGNCVSVYKLAKKEGTSHDCKFVKAEIEFPTDAHEAEIISVAISCTGAYIMTASSDTTVILWDLKGGMLKRLDTRQGNNYFADISPCGRFVGSGGFMPDAKFWEVKFDKAGHYVDAVRAFELKGHSSGIHAFGCNADTTRVVTASKEGAWKLWNTNVNYALNQEPYLLQTGLLEPLKTSIGARVAVAPNGHSFAISTGPDLHIFEGENGLLSVDGVVPRAHGAVIRSLVYSPDGDYIATTGDRHVNIFANIPGMREYLRGLQKELKSATNESQKARLEGLIGETKRKMKVVLERS